MFQEESQKREFAEKLESLLHRAYHLQEEFGSSLPSDSVLLDLGRASGCSKMPVSCLLLCLFCKPSKGGVTKCEWKRAQELRGVFVHELQHMWLLSLLQRRL